MQRRALGFLTPTLLMLTLLVSGNAFAGGGGPGGDPTDTIALYNPANGKGFQLNDNSTGAAVTTVTFGGAGFRPLADMFTSVGGANGTLGIHNQATGRYFISDTNSGSGGTLTQINFGASGAGWLPVSVDGLIGAYSPTNGTFFLADTNANGGGTVNQFRFGPTGTTTWFPIAGDWDGNGSVHVGLYNQTNGTFYLADANSAGGGTVTTVRLGPSNGTVAGILPVAGNFDGSDTLGDRVGIYNPATGNFFLADANTTGGGTVNTVRFGPTSSTLLPAAADFDGN